jgi:N6-adenine-specific methylase
MRIIAGTCRRIELEVAEESTTRPFLEMARGALFNALGDLVVDADALDLYAGSGALGLEALSRGAASCLFVERDRAAFLALQRNVAKCRMSHAAVCRCSDVATALSGLDKSFGLIFVDPPFPELKEWRIGGAAENVMAGIARSLAPDGVMVFRLEDGKATPPDWPDLRLDSERRYGRSRVCRYSRIG